MADLDKRMECRLLSKVFQTHSGIGEDKLFPAYPAASLPPDTGKAKWLEAYMNLF
jgi:hypothetical protein